MLNMHPQFIFKCPKQPDLVISPELRDSVNSVIVDSIPRHGVSNDFENVQTAVMTCDDTATGTI